MRPRLLIPAVCPCIPVFVFYLYIWAVAFFIRKTDINCMWSLNLYVAIGYHNSQIYGMILNITFLTIISDSSMKTTKKYIQYTREFSTLFGLISFKPTAQHFWPRITRQTASKFPKTAQIFSPKFGRQAKSFVWQVASAEI